MLARTHIAAGFLAGLALMPYLQIKGKALFMFIVLLGALMPDIDHPNSKLGRKLGIISSMLRFIFGHRKLFHSLLFVILISLLGYYFNNEAGIALFIGCTTHLIADSVTKQGLNIFYPISSFHVSGFIETGGFYETLLFLILLILIAVKTITLF